MKCGDVFFMQVEWHEKCCSMLTRLTWINISAALRTSPRKVSCRVGQLRFSGEMWWGEAILYDRCWCDAINCWAWFGANGIVVTSDVLALNDSFFRKTRMIIPLSTKFPKKISQNILLNITNLWCFAYIACPGVIVLNRYMEDESNWRLSPGKYNTNSNPNTWVAMVCYTNTNYHR